MFPAEASFPRSSPLRLSQERLDLDSRPGRTLALPWRGQFNPVLVDNLLTAYAAEARLVVDPFVGSGSVLFEAAARGITSIGLEVSHAAFELANLATLSSLPESVRLDSLAAVDAIVPELALVLPASQDPSGAMARALDHQDASGQKLLRCVLLLAFGNGAVTTPARLQRAFDRVREVVRVMPREPVQTQALLCDARSIPCSSTSVDAILTSPPYINVFNYHHNYRPVVEFLGRDVLPAARSEIGSNRKHRSNRFLTVVQYCIDMALALNEMSRVLKVGAPVILVVGRESNVLGTAFENGALVGKLAALSVGLDLVEQGERKFKNKFGEYIVEDLLVLEKASGTSCLELDQAREIGVSALQSARPRCPERNRQAIEDAIEKADRVDPSPMFASS